MIVINGFRVIGKTEPVLGFVLEVSENNCIEFKLVEYYINEYDKYLNRQVATFSIIPLGNKPAERWESLRRELGHYVRFDNVYIEEELANFLNMEIEDDELKEEK